MSSDLHNGFTIYTHTNGYKYIVDGTQDKAPLKTKCIPVSPHMNRDTRYLTTEYLRDSKGRPPHHELPEGVHFQIGDIVRLKTGTSPIRINAIVFNQYSLNSYISGDYVNTNHKIHDRISTDFTYYETKENTMTNASALYQFKINDVDTFGNYLATNSTGDWVMEVRGSKDVVAIPKADVQEVLPYTIGVKFLNSNQIYSYFAESGKFDLGFYLFDNPRGEGSFTIVQVVALDTKSRAATKDFAPLGKLSVDLY